MPDTVAATRKPLTVAEAVERRDRMRADCLALADEIIAQAATDVAVWVTGMHEAEAYSPYDARYNESAATQGRNRLIEAFMWLDCAVLKTA